MGMVYPIPTTGWYGYHWYYQISLLDRSQMIRNLVDPIPTLPTWMKFCFHHVRSNMIRTPMFFHPHHIQVKTCLKMGNTTDIPTNERFQAGNLRTVLMFFVGFIQEWSDSHRFFIFFHIFVTYDFTWFHVAQKTTAKKSHWGKPSAAAERTTRSSQGGDVFFQRRDATRRDGGFKDSKKWHPVSMTVISWMCIHTIVYL